MKKFLPYIIIAVVVLGGVGAYALIQSQNKDGTAGQTNGTNDSNSDTVPAKKYADACDVFTSEQLGAALGGTFMTGEEGIAPTTATPGTDDFEELRGSACDWDQENDGTTEGMKNALTIGLIINNFKDTTAAKEYFNELHTPPTTEGKEAMNTPVDVEGVGDRAFFAKVKVAEEVDEKTEMLYVLLGRQIISITATRLSGVDHDAMQASLIKLAKQL